jgi:two-component system sensor histidine kinase AlgZ
MTKPHAPPPATFFMPDLCSGRSVAVLILVAELLSLVLVLAKHGLRDSAWTDLALVSLYAQLVTLLTAAALCQLRRLLARLPRHVAALGAFAVILGVATAMALVANEAYANLLASTHLRPAGSRDVLAHVLIAGIIGGLVLRYFYVQEQLRAQQEAELQARIQALQSRIRPHFLFNSMNIIASLIAVDPDAAETAVEDLSDLFRASLRDAGTEVTLREELDLCRRYMRIEQLRMGDRLRIDWLVEDIPLDEIRIPLLTLQPLLENAIYHGIQPRAEGGTVTVRVGWLDGQVRIAVTNPLVSAPPGATGHTGNRMALANIRHRLHAFYGELAGLESGPAGDSYGTTLHYPFNIGRRVSP